MTLVHELFDTPSYVITCNNTNISEKSEFMEWKVSLQGRTYAVEVPPLLITCVRFGISNLSNFFRSFSLDRLR